MSFKPTSFEPDVWIRGQGRGYDYIGMHTDDVLVLAVNPNYISNKFKDTYKIKAFEAQKVHLGCEYSQFKKGANIRWVIGSLNYTKEALNKVCALLRVTSLQKEKFPRSPSDHPKLYSRRILGEEQNHIYQHLVGMSE